MRSRLIGALTSGVLVMAVAGPAMAYPPGLVIDNGASGDTTIVSVSVTAGTTLYVPATIDINLAPDTAAFPGQYVDNYEAILNSNAMITWWSNESAKHIHAGMGSLVGDIKEQIIDDADVHLWTVAPGNGGASGTVADKGSFDTLIPIVVTPIADVSTGGIGTQETAFSQFFYLRVFLPSAIDDSYTGTLAWSVQ